MFCGTPVEEAAVGSGVFASLEVLRA